MRVPSPAALRVAAKQLAQVARVLRLEAWGEAVFELSGRPFLEPLARYSGSILVVNGEKDGPNRKGEPGFLAAFPRAKLVVFEASPHGVSLWDPQRFGELVRDFARGVGQAS